MGTQVNIAHWTNRVHGFTEHRGQHHGVDKINDDLTNVVLADAVAELGIDAREHLCFKDLTVPVSIDLARSIRSQSRRWGKAFCRELKRRRDDGTFVRYRSLSEAHIACARGIIVNDLSRLWAWRQLGVIAIDDPGDAERNLEHWSRRSRTRGLHQAAVWRYLLRSPLLGVLSMRLKQRHWKMHLDGLAGALDADLSPIESYFKRNLESAVAEPAPGPNSGGGSSLAGEPGVAPVPALWREPQLRACLTNCRAETFPYLATVAVTLTEPALAGLPAQVRDTRLQQFRTAVGYTADTQRGRDKIFPPRDATAASFAGPDTRVESSRMSRDIESAQSDTFIFSEADSLQPLAVPLTGTGRPADDSPATHDAERLLTPYGGLFWVFDLLLRMPELVQRLTSARAFSGYLQSWIWVWFARRLLPDARYKTAAMAFAGLADEREFEEIVRCAPNPEQQAVLSTIAAALAEAFVDCVRRPGQNDAPQFEAYLYRNAEIQRDGPWMEIVFALDDVDIDVRRAGLDADPGFVSWLGLVIRFRYA